MRERDALLRWLSGDIVDNALSSLVSAMTQHVFFSVWIIGKRFDLLDKREREVDWDGNISDWFDLVTLD